MATTLGQAYVQIMPSAKGIAGSITKSLGGEAESAGASAGSSIVSKIKGAIVSAGIGAALKASLSEGAALEQSLGGVETLFGRNANMVKKFATDAYKTAGISANSYMENVTSFSASLLQSLKGNTKKAAVVADTAMKDMSDNMNKMGTPLESIQNAYQGFAKQNYTMLDNLKLGYGGTKKEMERLLADAGKLSGKKYNINNLSDVYNAIHQIQKNLKITGTTAKEAETTLSGSFGSMKASMQDFIGQMAIGGDISQPLNNLINTSKTFVVGNLIPALGNIMTSLGSIISVDAIAGISSGLSQGIPAFLNSALPMLVQFTGTLRANAGQLVDAGINFMQQLALGIANGLPTIIQNLPTIVSNLANIINDNAPKLLMAGLNIIVTLGQGLINSIPVLIANLPQIIMAVVDVISAFNWINLGKQLVTAISNGIKSMIGGIGSAASEIVSKINGAIAALPGMLLSLAKRGVSGMVSAFKGAPGALGGFARSIVSRVISGLASMPGRLFSFVKSAAGRMIEAFKNTNWLSVGTSIVNGIINGLTPGKIIEKMKSLASSALNTVKNFLGIHSPSRAFRDQVGRWIPPGIAEGIEKSAHYVYETLSGMDKQMLGSIDPEIMVTRTYVSEDFVPQRGQTNNNVRIRMTVEGSEDPEAWASSAARRLEMELRMME